MNKHYSTASPRLFLCALFCWLGATALAITPADLKQKLAAGERITLIDVRSSALFSQGHIVNAINVPAPLVALKQLPPLGKVVVYDDGLGPDVAAEAVAALNQKPGISAEALVGGFAAWESAQEETTKAAGLSKEELPFITYDKLKKTRSEDVVLVDLRKAPGAAAAAAKPNSGPKMAVAPVEPLTDLTKEFPNTRIVRSPFESGTRKAAVAGSGAASAQGPLLVLIDNGDGATAQDMARALQASGNKRFVILAGGEEIIARKGEPGLQRAGGSYSVQKQGSAATPPNN